MDIGRSFSSCMIIDNTPEKNLHTISYIFYKINTYEKN